MLRFIARRSGFVVLMIILSSLLIFVATHVLPGDVASAMLGQFATEQAKENLREELGLNKPLPAQYADWLGGFVIGHWGNSVSAHSDILPLVLSRLRNSAMLAGVRFAIFVPLGILLGLLAALRRNSWVDHVISVGSLAFIGLPEFV